MSISDESVLFSFYNKNYNDLSNFLMEKFFLSPMSCYGNYVVIKKLSNCHSTLMVTSAMEITITV